MVASLVFIAWGMKTWLLPPLSSELPFLIAGRGIFCPSKWLNGTIQLTLI